MTSIDSMPQPTMRKTLAGAELSSRARRVLEHQLQTASEELSRQLHVVLTESAQEFDRLGARAEDSQQQAMLRDAARRLREASAEFTTRFRQELESELAGVHAPRVARAMEPLNAPTQTLTLVDNAEMDEDTMLDTIAARSDSRNSAALQLLGHRYGVLAGAPVFDAEHVPVGPHALCRALRNTCHALLPAMAARQLVYQQFERITIPHYPALLDDLNAHLVVDGILPHLSFVPVRGRAATLSDNNVASATVPAAARDQGDSSPDLEIDIDADSDFDFPAGERVETGDGDQRDTNTSSWTMTTLDTEKDAAHVDVPAPASSDEAVSPRPVRIDSFGALQALIGRRRSLLEKLRAGDSDDRIRETLTREEVLGMLRRLRKGAGKHGSLADIRQTVMAQARQLHGHGVAMADVDNDSFDLLSLFLSQLQRELRGDSPGEALLERLQLPLLQLALREQDFFVDSAHPARMLLDAISLAGARWLAEDDLDMQWLGLLQRAVATALDDPDASRDSFVAANHALQDGLQAAARKTNMAERRQVDAARGREKLDLARQRATREIAALIDGRSLPRFHAILLDQAWTDVLSLALLRGGEDSEMWRELRSTTAAIIQASVATSTVARESAFTLRLQEALGQVGYHSEDAAAIARQLANGRAEDADLASRTALLVQLKSRTRLGEENLSQAGDPQPPLSSAELLARAQLATLVEARWIDMLDPVDDSVVRRRLAWVSPRSGHALLTNRRGQRVDGGNLDALARMLAAGRLRMVAEDIPPATIAWRAAVAALERIGGGNESDGAHA